MKRLPIAFLFVLAAVVAACGGADAAETSSEGSPSTSSTNMSSTTTSSTSTTTTVDEGIPSPINGLAVLDPELLERRVIAVKVENHPDARPQSGLQEADAVFEYLTEYGIGRFVALFHHSDSEYLGPVRSIRPTDHTLLARLGATLVVSGGAPWVQSLTTANGVGIMAEGIGGLFRISSRFAPHNLYGNTVALREDADGYGFDDEFANALFNIEEWETPPEETVESVTLSWAAYNTVTWIFEGGVFKRFEGDYVHEWIDRDGNRGQLAFDVLVIFEGNQYFTYPPPGVTTQALPSIETTGTGNMYILSGGRVLRGTWQRSSIADHFSLFDLDGNEVSVPPGVLWISFFPAGRSITFS